MPNIILKAFYIFLIHTQHRISIFCQTKQGFKNSPVLQGFLVYPTMLKDDKMLKSCLQYKVIKVEILVYENGE